MEPKTLTNISTNALSPIPDITKDFIRSTCPDIDAKAFDLKWNLLLSSTEPTAVMSFFRSFVRLYYLDLFPATQNGQFGNLWPAYGDAHLENFGIVLFKDKKVRYVFNDFDDGGYSVVGLDIVRYFTVMRLLNVDVDTIKNLAKNYSKLVTGDNPVDLEKLSEDWIIGGKSIYRKWNYDEILQKAKDAFDKKCVPSDSPLVEEIKKAFREEKKLKKYNVVDVREYTEHEQGGSGGLLRFWASVTGPDDVIEFKQLTVNPGTGYLYSKDPMIADQVNWCANSLWPKSSPKKYLTFQVKLSAGHFHVRTRIKKTLKGKTNKEKEEEWKIQVEIMAANHYGAWDNITGLSAKTLKNWLLENSDFIAKRYVAIFQNLQSQNKT